MRGMSLTREVGVTVEGREIHLQSLIGFMGRCYRWGKKCIAMAINQFVHVLVLASLTKP